MNPAVTTGAVFIVLGLLCLRRFVRGVVEERDPAQQVPARRLLRMSDFERETVDQFLHRAFNSPFPFEGKEWADKGEEREARDLARKTEPAPLAVFRGLEPGLIRVECTRCGDQKDAWVGDDGKLEDERDQWHSHGEDGAFQTRPVVE